MYDNSEKSKRIREWIVKDNLQRQATQREQILRQRATQRENVLRRQKLKRLRGKQRRLQQL